MTNSIIAQRLSQLRRSMQVLKADYYFVPAADPHRNEYVPDRWQRRRWISGFSGSAGDALIGLEKAYLWTDPRYFLQAEQELDADFYQLMKTEQAAWKPLCEWLLKQPNGFTFAVDPQVVSIAQVRQLRQVIEAKQAKLLLPEQNLIDPLWKDQPVLSSAKLQVYETRYAGVSAPDKIAALQQTLKEQGLEALVINDLASIAWLFNIRGQDIDYNPMVISRAILTLDGAHLFIDPQKSSDKIKTYCEQHLYDQFAGYLKKLTGKIWIDPQSCSEWIKQQLNNAEPVYETCPIPGLKAIKNSTEIAGMKAAHIEDGLALTRFFYWLENNWRKGVDELSAAKQLNVFRLENPRCLDLSFTTISGFAANGAVIHYCVNQASNKPIDDSSLYLVDSGGQYFEGTTDVTRTIHLGNPTDEQKKHYTLVLKGHLALRHAVFPQGTCGEHLNALAHLPLWKAYLDYGHGTGHGVGCYSCVHESPPRISAAISGAPLLPAMVVSNEPGVYFANRYGIRIENLCLVKLVAEKEDSDTNHGPFYGFEDLTMFPYCRKLIDKSALTTEEVQLINEYHQVVYQNLAPKLTEPCLKEWLSLATEAL